MPIKRHTFQLAGRRIDPSVAKVELDMRVYRDTSNPLAADVSLRSDTTESFERTSRIDTTPPALSGGWREI